MIRIAIAVRNAIHHAYVWWEGFCCRRLDAHWPIVKYTDERVGNYPMPKFAGYFCKLCDKQLDGIGNHIYTRTFSKHCYLWKRKP